MSRRALKAINWAAISERVSEADKNIFINFKAKSDLYLRMVQENPEVAPKIDWALYKKSISVPGMVDNFQKQYEALKVPYPPDNYTSIIEAEEKEAIINIENFIKESNRMIEEAKAEVARVKSLLPIDQMTMEDFRDAYPEEALDPLNNPTIWPHQAHQQPGAFKEDAGATAH